MDQSRLGPVLTRSNEAAKLRQMILSVGLGRFDQGFESQALTIGVFARLVFPHSVLTDVESQEIHSRLIPFQGVAHARFVGIQRQSHLRQPVDQERLTVIENGAIRVQHQTIIRVCDDPGFRIDLGDGLIHPMQSDQR
jgi:hypothetical protein